MFNFILCGWRFETGILHIISSGFFSSSKAFASELLENLEEMFPLYWYFWATGFVKEHSGQTCLRYELNTHSFNTALAPHRKDAD